VVLRDVVGQIKDNPKVLSKLSHHVLTSVEEVKRSPQPDIQHMATDIYADIRQ